MGRVCSASEGSGLDCALAGRNSLRIIFGGEPTTTSFLTHLTSHEQRFLVRCAPARQEAGPRNVYLIAVAL